ncbi:MAG TPA: amino acid adenylation domain-containing protein, partial [Thermoanaerobaculia bacterium]|nr:amino acid adenylation domain-containing protein [Thermoanaerobaculia bacterium]
MSEIDRLATAVGLSAEQRELLASLLAEEGIDLESEPPITPRRGQGDLQLSFAQQRLWFLQRLDPQSPFYNIAVEVRLAGALDVPVLGRALAEVTRRHETLRTTFVEAGGEPRVSVAAPGPVRQPLVDLSGLPAAAASRLAAELTLAAARRPFDLAAGPLLRVLLLRLGRREHRVVMTLHHIVADGWSLGVLVNEVGALYGAYRRGGRSPLPELPFQYSDHAAWQRSWLQGAVLEQELAHWRAKLAGVEPVLDLPFDHPRPAVRSDRGSTRVFVLPAELAQSVERLSRCEGVSLFMTLLGAFFALLGRYTGQRDLVIGYPAANRDRSDIEGLIGLFLNTLVLRVDLSGDPSARALLGRVRDEVLEAQSHAQLPFEMLVRELRPERSLGYNPLFQVLFVLQNTPAFELEIPGLTIEASLLDLAIAQFDLSCRIEKSGDTLLGRLEYSEDLFESTTIERLAGHFERLLAATVADPQRPLSQLPLLTRGERHQLLAEWNDTEGEWRECAVHRLIEEQVRRTPEAPALVWGKEVWSYGHLNAWANRLARHLLACGLRRGEPVGIGLRRSPWVAVSVLGVLKAGGCYVPLDPTHPADRLAYMVADAGARLVMSEEGLAGAAWLSGRRQVRVDGDREAIGALEAGDLDLEVGPEEPVYVIYTSGSTGRPKGVELSHRSLASFLVTMLERPGLGPEDVVAGVTALPFDPSGLELFLPLVVGARLVVASEDETRDGRRLLRLLKASGVTLLQATPVTWGMLLEAGWSGEPALRALCGGEALSEHLARELIRRSREVWNLYGPTETTVWSVVGRVREGERITVGRMVARMTSYVLSDALEVAPVGVMGELWVGGIGLAHGYAGQPALTAERFLPSPFGGPGERLYRTGDVVRRLPDGRLEHLGRGDHQVKVRGHRIELGEIESALAGHPGVAQAVVVARGEGGGDLRLVAYVVMSGTDPAPDWDELRSHLAARLPDYMVPAVFVALPELPLTPNRKVDRRALPAPAGAGPRRQSPAPRGSQEELLAGIFAEVLKLEWVGVEDNFFELGGHSLQAAQVAARVYAAFGVEMSLRTLFEDPTVAALAARIAPASDPKQAPPGLSTIATADVPTAPVVPGVQEPRAGGLPLSFAQQRLWFLDQLEPGSPVYNISTEVELKGGLVVEVLAGAFGEVVRRHEALRTTFRTVAGEAVQVVAAHAGHGLPVIDLRALPGRQRTQEVSRLRAAEARRPFDLGQGPLLRTSLLRLGTMHHTILVTVHHIVSDGWSMGLLVREIGVLYAAFLAGAPSPLPELAMQYAGFAAWQRRHLSGEYLASELAWWRRQLAGMPPALELPVDHPRPAVRSGRGGEHIFILKAASLAGLKAFSGQHGATLFMTLLAGFLALLQRYTGEDDLAVGTPVAGRTRVEMEPLVGLFVNTLVLRADLAGDPEVLPLLDRVRETTLSAYSHQEVPFERLVEELSPERDLSRSPLVQVLFVFHNVPSGPLALPGLELKAAPVPTATTKFDLTFTLVEMERGLEGTLEYSRDLFDPGTVERLADHFTRLLTAAVAAPHQRLSQLPLLSEAERRQLLDRHEGQPEAGRETTLTALWAAAVARAPEAPAVSFEDDTLSYGELDRHANRLAWRLRRQGVGPESRVGVLLDRSLEQVVALLGILKAGGAYVPFDPSAPEERLAWLCADAGIQALVTDDRDELPPVAALVRLDRIADELDDELEPDDRDLPGLVGADDLCYVIYTSGSTGRPKGVLVRHGSVARLLSATERWFNFGPADVWTLFHSYSFDFSVWELWGALAYGGRLVVVPHWVSRSPEAFWRLLAEERVTVLNQTPSAFRQLIQADGEVTAAQRARLALRLVIFGGEALDLASLRPWYERHPPSEADAPRLVNMYGITETTVHVSYRPLDPADLAQSHRSPIGEAIPDLGLRVLSPGLELVPVGVPGEICVGGAGLARGYLGRPELTAERFVPDPFSAVPGARLYRSGDLARYRPDGELDYLGRRDHQVKVRGFRVEPGEIEAALLAHAGVRSAAVLPRQDASGGVSLVAYVETSEAPAGELRQSLRDRLPEYMVPAAFVLLKSIPLTVNGKLDRKALAALPLEAGESADAGVKPRTRTEELVAGIFAEVLSLERVGPAADFFALGGHSLLATQVASRLRNVFGVELAVRVVFEAPTVEALAGRIESRLAGLPAAGLPAMTRARREDRLELSFAQQRLWFLDQLQPGSAMYNIPVVVELTGRLDVAVLMASLAEVVRRQKALRTTFRAVAGQPVQVVAERVESGLPVIDLRSLPDEERELEASRLATAEARRPFDLGRGPLLRVALLSLGAEQHRALLTMHHIVSDGWSMGVLVRELGTLYAAFLAGVPSPLPELALQYADFAVWQRRRLSGELLESELAWWRGQLAGVPPALELPADHPRPATLSGRGEVRSFALPAASLAGLNVLSRRHGATLFMTLLAGFAALLQRCTGEDDLVLGTPIAGRTRVETEPLIGLFVNTLMLRARLAGEPPFAALLDQVRETTLAAYAHQEVPFERLVEELAPQRDLSRPPLVQVMLVVQNAPAAPLALPGLALQAAPVDTGAARLELTCSLLETEQGLEGSVEYSRDLFEAPTIARLAGHFTRLLAAAVADPGRPLSQLPLLSTAERHQVLGEWNDSAAAHPRGLCLHELVAAQAQRTPAAVAAAFEGESLTYG